MSSSPDTTESAKWSCIQARCSQRLVDDPLGVPGRDLLLTYVLGHERGVDLVDVVEAHDDDVGDAARLRRALGGQPEADHASSS